VRSVREQGQRSGQHADRDLGHHEAQDQRQRRLQRTSLGLAAVPVNVCVIVSDERIVRRQRRLS
jgi:hypothetical protein